MNSVEVTCTNLDRANLHCADLRSYTCPAGKLLLQYRKRFSKPRSGIIKGNRRHYRAERRDCAACPLKPKCCPGPDPRKLSVSVHEASRDIVRNLPPTGLGAGLGCAPRRIQCRDGRINAATAGYHSARSLPSGDSPHRLNERTLKLTL